MLAEMVHERFDAPTVCVARDADRILEGLPRDPLRGESHQETHRPRANPARGSNRFRTAPRGDGHTGFCHAMQKWTHSGFRRPQFVHRTRMSVARSASRCRAVFALPTPDTTPTRRKIHQRRMSHPPIPARTPPMTKRIIAPIIV